MADNTYGSPRVDAWIDAAPDHRMTEDDFALAAVACADQAGVDVATQEQIRSLIEASRRRDAAVPTPEEIAGTVARLPVTPSEWAADVRARIAADATRSETRSRR